VQPDCGILFAYFSGGIYLKPVQIWSGKAGKRISDFRFEDFRLPTVIKLVPSFKFQVEEWAY